MDSQGREGGMTTDFQMPHDGEAEKATLGGILLSGTPALEAALAANCEAIDFYLEDNRTIFRAAFALAAEGTPIDLITVKGKLQDSDPGKAVGIEYLAGLTEGIPASLNVSAYAARVHSKAQERRLVQSLNNALVAAQSGNGDLGKALEDLKNYLEAHESHGDERGNQGLARKVKEYIEGIEGTFQTAQVYSDLGAVDTKAKAAVRQALARFNGVLIQPYGDKSGLWRTIRGEIQEMDLDNVVVEDLRLWLPFDLHNYAQILPNNLIVITGDPDSGKTAFLLNIIKHNIQDWQCHYFNSEMGSVELRKRLDLFGDFPIKHPNFRAYERSSSFQDVVQPGKYVLNVIDFLEITDEFYLVAKHLADIYRNLGDSIAVVAIQKKSQACDLPLGADRSLEKPRLVVSLSRGNRSEPNRAKILKCKNRKTQHSMIGKTRYYKLIAGSEFRCDSPEWS
jgi:hypothetical protein